MLQTDGRTGRSHPRGHPRGYADQTCSAGVPGRRPRHQRGSRLSGGSGGGSAASPSPDPGPSLPDPGSQSLPLRSQPPFRCSSHTSSRPPSRTSEDPCEHTGFTGRPTSPPTSRAAALTLCHPPSTAPGPGEAVHPAGVPTLPRRRQQAGGRRRGHGPEAGCRGAGRGRGRRCHHTRRGRRLRAHRDPNAEARTLAPPARFRDGSAAPWRL